MAGTLTQIQCSLINTEKAFQIGNTKNLGYPLAPMTSAKFDTDLSGNPSLKIRATIFIDSAAGTDPNELKFTYVEIESTLTLILNYNYTEETPVAFSCFYVELDYNSDTMKNINTVVTQLNDIDPKGSRGTRTVVVQG